MFDLLKGVGMLLIVFAHTSELYPCLLYTSFCDPDGHGPYVQCRDPLPVDEYTPKLGTLTMENIVATDAQFAGCYFDGLPEQPLSLIHISS